MNKWVGGDERLKARKVIFEAFVAVYIRGNLEEIAKVKLISSPWGRFVGKDASTNFRLATFEL